MERDGPRGYEDLEVYRRGVALVKPLHDLVVGFPDYERFELASQMRRACKSVPTNVAEGYARRRSPKDFCNFLTIALGSANEMEVHFEIAHILGYVTGEDRERFTSEYRIIGKQLNRLIQYWRSASAPATSNQRQGDQ
jgi:four helix bundle protein